MRPLLMLALLLAPFTSGAAAVMLESHEQRITRLEQQVNHLDTVAGASVLCAALCALWAQNTRRNAWLWFFLGLIFSVIALIVILSKNAGDIRAQRRLSRPIHTS